MREIKFRGKRIDNGEWFYGYLIKQFDILKIYQDEKTTNFAEWIHAVDPATIGQYTGLKDKNGVEIYEGDVVRCDCLEGGFCAIVEFGNPNGLYSWGWQLKPISMTNFNLDTLLWIETELDHVTCEIIGNIHNNPELLGGAE